MELYAYGTLSVIAITCWVSWLGFRSQEFENRYIFWPEAILGWRQYYRLLTSGFLHLNYWHLGMNMMTLYFFGPRIEEACGTTQFLAIYLASMVGGDLLSLYVHRHHDYRALGASGGVSGILLAYVMLYPGGTLSVGWLPIFVPGWVYALAYLVASFYGMQRGMANVGHDAHLGGALVGLFTAVAFHPTVVRYSPVLFATVTVGTILLYIYLAKNPLFLPLEGFDLTSTKTRVPKPSSGGSRWFGLHRWQRRPASSGNARPDRQVDAILQRISEHGIQSLTEEEKRLLNDTSVKYRRREIRKPPESGFPF